jgi:Flp pilus assembly protein TadD
LGIGLIETGMDRGSAKDILSGYRTLTEVQEQFPRDSEIYNSLGSALLAGGQYSEAVRAFDLAVRFDPSSSQKETSLGQSYLLLGEQTAGEQHLERAMALDRLNLSAAALLITAYDKSGHPEKSAQLSQRIADLTRRKVIQKWVLRLRATIGMLVSGKSSLRRQISPSARFAHPDLLDQLLAPLPIRFGHVLEDAHLLR